MKRQDARGFTLIEILTVIVVILIIAGFVIHAAGSAQIHGAKARARAEIAAISAACEAYKADNGTYPRRAGVTEPEETANAASPIDPKKDGNARSQNYQIASQYLYTELSGDKDLNGRLGGTGEPTKGYMAFDKNQLGATKDAAGVITRVNYIQDPFGNSYGYSTAGAKAEESYLGQLAANGSKADPRSANSPGYNPTYDLWSTADKKPPVAGQTVTDQDRNQWVKNW